MKVLVGMSGGVDSSVAAAMLKERGYDVTGVFLLTQNNAEDNGTTQRAQSDIEDVKKVCEILNIPLKIVDARKIFRDSVVKYFLDEYGAGRTPNPCVFCNENFKFKMLFDLADEIRADCVATGHYARLRREIQNLKSQIPNLAYRQAGKFKIQNSKLKTNQKLFVAEDEEKDQSYFLYRLKQEDLSRIIFPLGEYKKAEVRKIAEKLGLPVSAKKESQDVCFLRGESPEEFLKKSIKMKKGSITDVQGNILGEHHGLIFYTTGQRKGIKIGGTGPYYVVARDFEKNALVVSNKKAEVALYSKKAKIGNVSWVASAEPVFPLKALAMTRYRNQLVRATIESRIHADEECAADFTRKEYEVEFEKAERAVAAGQSVVFYTAEGEVMGGGVVG